MYKQHTIHGCITHNQMKYVCTQINFVSLWTGSSSLYFECYIFIYTETRPSEQMFEKCKYIGKHRKNTQFSDHSYTTARKVRKGRESNKIQN